MAEGDLYLALEPPGYYYAEEEGASFTITGHDFRKKAIKRDVDNFFIAPGSPWLVPHSKQMRDKWDSDPDKANHLQAHDDWDYTSGVIHRKEYLDQRTIGVTPNPAHEWVYVRTLPEEEIVLAPPIYPVALNGSTHSVFSTMERDAKVTLPILYVVAATKNVMPGRKSPFIHTSINPKPHDVVVFGCGIVVFVVVRGNIHVLKLDVTTDDYAYLGSFGVGEKNKTTRGLDTSFSSTTDYAVGVTVEHYGQKTLAFQDFSAQPIGLDEIWLGGHSWGQLIRMDKSLDHFGPRLGNNWLGETVLGRFHGKWWVAMPADEELYFQIERLAWAPAQHVQDEDMEVPPEFGSVQKEPLMFNFGPGYTPTPEPEHMVDCLLHGPAPLNLFLSHDFGGVSIGGTWGNSDTGEEVHYRLLSDLYLPWNCNRGTGKEYAGRVHFKLTPADDGESVPQLRLIMYRWDEVLVPRTRYLDDAEPLMVGATDVIGPTQWNEFRISSSMIDVDSKQFEALYQETPYKPIEHFVDGLPTLLGPYENRTGFPIEIWKERADGSFRTVGAAWLTKIEKQEPRWIDQDWDGEDDSPVRRYRLIGRGLTRRMRQPWAFTATVDSPGTDGRVNHVQAVKQAALQSGFKDEPGVLDFVDDEFNYLPGDIRSLSGASGSAPRKSAFHPDWNQLKLDYVIMLALGWSGWNFYELLSGLLKYEPDVLQQLHLLGISPDILTTFYASHDDAVAAGVPNHVWLADPAPERIILEIQANVVRVVGKGDEEGDSIQVILKDDKSIRGPTTYPNFYGEAKVVVVHIDLAVNTPSAHRIATMMLNRFKLRGELLRWRVPVAAWDAVTEAPENVLDSGGACVVQHHGNYVIVHAEVDVHSQVERHVDQYTNYTGWRWPLGPDGSLAPF